MPRAQDILPGAVLWISSLIVLETVAENFGLQQIATLHSEVLGDFGVFDRNDFFNDEWSQKDLAALEQIMDDHVKRFKLELETYNFSPRFHRSKRATIRIPTVTTMNRMPKTSLNATASQLESQGAISCFVWNGERFCILGGTIFVFKMGKVEPFLSGLPIDTNDHIKTYVYDDVIFLTIYSKTSLRLYLLQSPGWMTLVSIQHITGEVLEDCVFFEHEGTLYMALAIQLGAMQYSRHSGMQCIIYEWLGTTMDMKHAFPAPELRKIGVLQSSDTVHLALLHADSAVHLRQFTDAEDTELLEIINIDLDRVYQFDTFLTEAQWCLLLAGSNNSYIYCLEEERLLQWQTLPHNQTSSAVSWMRIQQEGISGGSDSTILIFNAFNSQSHFQFYASDTSGHFHPIFAASEDNFDGQPLATLALLDGSSSAHLYVATTNQNKFFLESFAIQMSEDFREEPEIDPLQKCLIDVDSLISKRDTGIIDRVEELKNNMVHFKDNVTTNGTVVIAQVNFSQSPVIDTIKVLYNFSEEFVRPNEIEIALKGLEIAATNLSQEIPNLLYSTNSTFMGRLRLNRAVVTADDVRLPEASIKSLNGRDWDEFSRQAWRYSSPEHTFPHDIWVGDLKAENVSVGSTIGGSLPSRWLLKSGGKINGRVDLGSLDVRDNIDVGKNSINGVAVEDTLRKNASQLVIQGTKSFSAIEVKNNLTTNTVNERNFRAWSEILILQNSEKEQHFTGTVRIVGPVQVVESFRSGWINGINVSMLPGVLVDKNAHQIVKGFINFTGPLLVNDAEVDSLNDLLIKDLLSTSGQQTILASIEVDVLDVQGNIDCPDINGRNVDDFLYTDEDNMKIALGRVRFSDDLTVKNLVVENGSLNGVDVITLLDPPSLRIDSKIYANGDLAAHAAHVQKINKIDLSKLSQNYWTKSTDQTIPVNVRMPFEVVMKENVTTRTFMERFLDRDFFLTKTNQTFNVDVQFTDDVTVHGDMVIRDLKDINGVTLESLDEDVVKKEGDFHVSGTKTFEQLTIHGNLAVEDTFNNLNIPQDIALLNRSQTLTGTFFTSDVTVDGDLISSAGDITLNTVAGVVLDDFVAAAATIDEDATINGHIHFKRHLEVDDLVIGNSLNGRDVTDIVSKGLRRKHLNLVQWPKVTIHGHVTFKESFETDTINSYNVEDYLSQVVNMTDPKRINGTKKTLHPIVVEKNVMLGLFNGVRLNFSTMLTVSDNQTITGDWVVDHLKSENIDLRAINGQNLSDFVQIAGTHDVQSITGPMDIQHVAVENSLKIEDHVLNGCNLTEYLNVTEFTHFDSLSIRNGSLLLDQPSENNPDLAMISLRALRKDRAQVVTGNVSFSSDVLMEKLNLSSNRLGSVDLNQLLHGSMLKSAIQNVTGTVRYLNGIQVENVNVGHLNVTKWNGKDVKEMVDQVVLKTGNQTVRAKKTFRGDWDIQGNLNISGHIDDVPVASLVKVNDSQLPPRTKFTSLLVKEQLNVISGMIDGVNLTSVLQQRVPLRGNSTIKSNIVFKDLVTADNISAKKINNLNMSDLAWKTIAPGQIITGKKHLNGTMDIQGDITVDLLNGRNPEENAAFVVLKDQNADFQHPVVFDGGLTVLKSVNITDYNEASFDQLIANVSARITIPEIQPKILPERISALPLLRSLQRSKGKLSSFEFFERIQQIPFSFPRGSNFSMHIQHCPIPPRKQSSTSDTAAGILVATHSTDGNNCKLKKICRCHHSVTLPSDTNGYLNTLRIPTRLKDYLEDNLVYGDRVRLFHSRDQLFVLTIESLSSCLAEKVSMAVFNPLTFKLLRKTVFELKDIVADVALVRRNEDGVVILAIGQKTAGVWIYSFDGHTFKRQQLVETETVASIHMSSHKNTTFLAIASYGLEAVSSIWNANSSGKFELIKDVLTVGATDVIFTKSRDEIHVTFAQDPSSIDAYSDSWSQFKVPAQVLQFIPSFGTFEVVQQLDIDRIVSLTNLVIDGDAFMAVATFTGKVRVYRLIQGQGFQVEQTFKYPGVRSITGYSTRNETFLVAASESRMAIFMARLRGFQKPSIEL
ncbi:uncharacterized protein LOC130693696 [Daphnia carinata]|uniref:uncharacterized protein LOC130693696 n=1 Tax=Daphnia carinata TaxID=120202 RepID=UPI00257E10B4|nr:uncharacterized protein LOC130693696 [Daphnia carinata]